MPLVTIRMARSGKCYERWTNTRYAENGEDESTVIFLGAATGGPEPGSSRVSSSSSSIARTRERRRASVCCHSGDLASGLWQPGPREGSWVSAWGGGGARGDMVRAKADAGSVLGRTGFP